MGVMVTDAVANRKLAGRPREPSEVWLIVAAKCRYRYLSDVAPVVGACLWFTSTSSPT